MSHTQELFASLKVESNLDRAELAAGVDILLECEEAVTACAAGMLSEPNAAPLISAVVADLDCADVVATTRRLLTRHAGPDTSLLSAALETCLLACERSSRLCGEHADHHEHCRMCAQATTRCAEMSRALLRTIHH
ncbi:hypothetical protein [Nocardia aurantiaca]|uniref:Four-helix bundle copper-binding protein n=1 Tax=Nocardia aurantiaca TaxID=2675850 RepID=A0A6I3KZ58_9NOCA|nr:hypothetical protein [Nocardia aurantiaca]MTE15342.1 hypothetical protein [Nocardia aurantiaca]